MRHVLKCNKCGVIQEVSIPIKGDLSLDIKCTNKTVEGKICTGFMLKDWSRNIVSFSLVGSGWSSKNLRVKRELTARNKKLSETQWDKYPVSTPAGKPRNPTVGGPLAKV